MILRPMAHADIAAGLRLCRAAQWNQLEDDWRCFLELKGSGCMLAERDGSVIGTAAFLRYGSSFSWISMMLVDPRERGAGIGSRLLESALDALGPQSCVRLDATPLGQPLYCRHGFAPEYELDRAKVTVAAERFHPLPGAARPMEPEDLHRVLEFDRQVFGADRRELLVSLYRRAPKFAWIAGQGTLLAGYSFGRPGYLYNQLSPIIAESAAIARELGVSEAAVSKWKNKLGSKGRRALEAQPVPGRPAKLTDKQQRQLVRILKHGAGQAGFETQRWTQQRIQQVIEREFDVHYHPNYISRLMQKLGWSVQKPETRALERDEDLIRAWLSQDWNRIKKSAAARRRDRL